MEGAQVYAREFFMYLILHKKRIERKTELQKEKEKRQYHQENSFSSYDANVIVVWVLRYWDSQEFLPEYFKKEAR